MAGCSWLLAMTARAGQKENDMPAFLVKSSELLSYDSPIGRVDTDTLLYEFTVNDPAEFTRPWTARVPMKRTSELMYEYACHEGNYGMTNLLAGARAEEKAAGAAATNPKEK